MVGPVGADGHHRVGGRAEGADARGPAGDLDSGEAPLGAEVLWQHAAERGVLGDGGLLVFGGVGHREDVDRPVAARRAQQSRVGATNEKYSILTIAFVKSSASIFKIT